MRNLSAHGLTVLAALLCFGQAGCLSTGPEAVDDETEAPVAGPLLSAEEIANVLIATNDAEIAQGRIALQRASKAKVRAFAERMIAEHTDSNRRLERLLSMYGGTPRDSAVSQAITLRGAAETELLKQVPRQVFDLTYIEQQIVAHEEALRVFDESLIPSAEGQPFQPLLVEERGTIAGHLAHARSILREWLPL